MKPFRWDLRRREQLGSLVVGERAETYPEFLDELKQCSSRVVGAAGDSDLVFVGRSPESIFDYLSGVLSPTSWSDRLSLINLSLKESSGETKRFERSAALEAFRRHLTEQGLSPQGIVSNGRPLALIDLVYGGETFERLMAMLTDWARFESADLPAIRRQLRFVGVTWRSKPSPKTWRWAQHAPWLGSFPRIVAKNISVPGSLWSYLGNTQSKVSRSHPPWRWADSDSATPPRAEENLKALRLAVELFDLGAGAEERRSFASVLAARREMRESWYRGLVSELSGAAA